MQDKLEKELKKKALGYTVKESCEEYANIEGSMQLTKQKITKKHIPPDIAAYKFLLELKGGESIEDLTDEQLKEEKEKLLSLLSEQDNQAGDRPKAKSKK